jgi:hypothetical protein
MNANNVFVRVFRIGKREQYLCLDQNPLTLVYLLYRNGRPLHYRGSGLRSILGGYKRLLQAALLLSYYRLFPVSSSNLIHLPVTGQVCLHVRNGYKVFDFRRSIVAKIFLPDVEQAKIENEIGWVTRLGGRQFAPTIRRSNVRERWYEEDYINGEPISADDWEALISLIAETILGFEPSRVSALQFAIDRRDKIKESALFNRHFDEAKLAKLQRFLDSTIDKLSTFQSVPLFLVCSHGDYSASHVITSNRGNIVIDWEAAAYRSALYDLHNTFFRRLRGMPESLVAPQAISRAISSLKKQLSNSDDKQYDELNLSLESTDVYRLVYYIEYIYSYVQKGKFRARHLDKIIFFINAFERHESLRRPVSAG